MTISNTNNFTVQGTELVRPVAEEAQAVSVLSLDDGFLFSFSRHSQSRYSFRYWPFQRSTSILQMGVMDCRTNYTGLFPGLGDFFYLSIESPTGEVFSETETNLISQEINTHAIEQIHQAGENKWATHITSIPNITGVRFRVELPDGCKLHLKTDVPEGEGSFGILAQDKNPGSYYDDMGRTNKSVLEIGHPQCTFNETTLTTSYSDASCEQDPRGVLSLTTGSFLEAPATDSNIFDKGLSFAISPENGVVEWVLFAADNQAQQNNIQQSLYDCYADAFSASQSYWKTWVQTCHKAIESHTGVNLESLSETDKTIMDHNLIYLKQLQVGAGSWLASITNYWFSYTRDDGIALEYAFRLGLGKIFGPDLCRAFRNNFIEDPVHKARYWDTWYNNNHRDTEPIHSQSDSIYFGIRAVYLTWKEVDSNTIDAELWALMKDAYAYLRKRYYDNEKGMFKAVRVNESAVSLTNESLTPTGKPIEHVIDLYYGTQGYGILLMLKEIATQRGETEYVAELEKTCAGMHNRMEQIFLSDKDELVHYGLLKGQDGYHSVDYGWWFKNDKDEEVYSSNKHEVAFCWALNIFPPEFCVFDQECRNRTSELFNEKRKHHGTFDEILLAETPSLHDEKLDLFLSSAPVAGNIWVYFFNKDDDFKNAKLLVPWGIRELLNSGRKPQAFTITPTLYHMVMRYKNKLKATC